MTGNLITKKARSLRNNPTESEKKLWNHIRSEQLGVKFRRQYPLGSYFADFACKEKKLIIELDGGQHAEETKRRYDDNRTAYIESQGYKVLCFWNNEIFENMEGVIRTIVQQLSSPLPRGEKEN